MGRNISNISVAIVLLLVQCKNNKQSDIIYSKFIYPIDQKIDSLNRNNKFITYFQYSENKELLAIKSILDKKPYGHLFRFNKLGNLENYSFLTGDSLYHTFQVYSNNSLPTGYMEEGNCFVDYMENVSDTTYQKKYSLLFSEFPRSEIKAYTSLNGKDYFSLPLHKSNFIPLVSEGNLKLDRSVNKIYLKIISDQLLIKLNNLPESLTIHDTITLQ